MSKEQIISEELIKKFEKNIRVNSWIMSENTEENLDWKEKDESLSLKIIDLFSFYDDKLYFCGSRFSISDKNGNEVKPHYEIDIQIGDIKKEELSSDLYIKYLTKINGEELKGNIKVTVSFYASIDERIMLAKIIFEEYCKLLNEYYPEIDTEYFGENREGKYVPYIFLKKELGISLNKEFK